MHKNANGSIKHHVYHSWLVWVTFLFAIHFKTHFICQAYKSLKNESFLIWMIIKSLVLWVLGTELRLISNWYVHHHIVLEAYGLVVTDWVVFPMLGQGVRRLFTGPSWVWSKASSEMLPIIPDQHWSDQKMVPRTLAKHKYSPALLLLCLSIISLLN